MFALLGDPFLFKVNRLNEKIWESGDSNLEKLRDYIGKQHKVETDSKRLEDKFETFFEDDGPNRKRKIRKISSWSVANLIFSSFKGSYVILFMLKFLQIIAVCFLAFSLKQFKESFGKGSEYVKGATLIVNQVIEVLFNIYVDYYSQMLHIRVRGSLTLFLINLILRSKRSERISGSPKIMLKDHNVQIFSRIQNVISVDGEFAEYIVSYGIEILLFPLNLISLTGISNIFIDFESIKLCAIVLFFSGVICIGSQFLSSRYKKHFMESREERIASLTKTISQNDDFILTHLHNIFYLNLLKTFRSLEMKFNKYRKFWFCVGEVVSHWMEIICSIVICIYCYKKNYSGSMSMNILSNCSFVIPALVRPISSIAYFTYYITEALNAIDRIRNIVDNIEILYNPQKSLDASTQVRINELEHIKIQDLESGEEVTLRKGHINVILDKSKHEPSMKISEFFDKILDFSDTNSKFKFEYKVKGSPETIHSRSLENISDFLCYVNKRAWVFDNTRLDEMITSDKPFDHQLWKQVIQVCQIDTDIHNRNIFLNEIISSKQMSTGQRIRVSTARSLYNSFYNAKTSKSVHSENGTYCVFYLLENVFDSLDEETSCRLLHFLFSRNCAQESVGVLNSSFGILCLSSDILNIFIFSIYIKACRNGISTVDEEKLEEQESFQIDLVEIEDGGSIRKVHELETGELIMGNLRKDDEIISQIEYYLNNNRVSPLGKREIKIERLNTAREKCKAENYSANSYSNMKRENKLNIDKYVDTMISVKEGKRISNSLKFYLFQINDKIKYKFDEKMTMSANIKRNKSLIFIYLILSIIPVLVFKITEYKIINGLNTTKSLLKDLTKYIHFCILILGNYLITIFLEIYVGLKSANYIHNTILYGFLASYSMLKVVPVSSILGHLSNDQLVIDYCITKRIGQIIQYMNKIFSFLLISIILNFKEPMTCLPVVFLYLLFIYWNYLSYFVNSCRVLRLLFLNSQTSITDISHSINLGIKDIRINNYYNYFNNKCTQKARDLVEPLYYQNMLFAWLRLRIDLLLPVSLTSLNIILPIIFSKGISNYSPSGIFIYVIGVGLNIPKITSSLVKYWVKLENELLAVTRMKLLIEALRDDRFEKNLEVLQNNDDPTILMSLNNVECRHFKLKSDPFSTVISSYGSLIQHLCLKRVNLEIRKGDVIGVIGRTGSGKTSILNLIGGIMEITGGKKVIYSSLIDIMDETSGEKEDLSDSICCYIDNEKNQRKRDESREGEYYCLKKSSLDAIKEISNLSEIDPTILLNSVKTLELLSCIAYVPIKVDFPDNLTLSQVIDFEMHNSCLEILDLFDLFGLINKINHLIDENLDQDESQEQSQNCSLLPLHKNLQFLSLPISHFEFSPDQRRVLLLLRFALNSLSYKLLLIDELPNFSFKTEDARYTTVIDYVLKKYFSHCSVVIATHHFESVTSINRLFVVNDDRTFSKVY
ncbi:ABC transporter [Cryptosporidium felis]|nr:ABC transporter [Cryptosporidium felis]